MIPDCVGLWWYKPDAGNRLWRPEMVFSDADGDGFVISPFGLVVPVDRASGVFGERLYAPDEREEAK